MHTSSANVGILVLAVVGTSEVKIDFIKRYHNKNYLIFISQLIIFTFIKHKLEITTIIIFSCKSFYADNITPAQEKALIEISDKAKKVTVLFNIDIWQMVQKFRCFPVMYIPPG